MRLWYRLRVKLHWFWHRCVPLPFDDHIVWACDCGGHARVYRNPDGTALVTETSCQAWVWIDRARRVPLPIARALP